MERVKQYSLLDILRLCNTRNLITVLIVPIWILSWTRLSPKTQFSMIPSCTDRQDPTSPRPLKVIDKNLVLIDDLH